MSLTGKHELGYRFTCRDDKMYGCYDDQGWSVLVPGLF